jgi:NodT family efflux transporter outer membrane factor (OMF) lipoprotein
MTGGLRSFHAGLLAAVASLAACTVGPAYRAPTVAMPAAFGEADARAQAAASVPDADLSAWWIEFKDPVLTRLIERGLGSSLTLEAAASRIRQSRLAQIEVGAAAYPSLSATGSVLGYRSNNDASGSASGGSTLSLPSHLHLFSAGFDASWEVDLFGATRHAVEAAQATTEALVWARRDGEVSLTAEIANDYFVLRSTQARLAIARAALARQQALFDLIRARRQAGFITMLDVEQQSARVAVVAAQVPPLQAQARLAIHALGVLLGQAPQTLAPELEADGDLALPSALPPALPSPMLAALPTPALGLPSTLLLRRPDIRQAERELAASQAQVGVKTASLYPKFNLLGLASFAGMSASHLFASQNAMAAALGMVAEPVFDAGRTRAALGAAQEQLVQAELAYRAAVLVALRDVEDALAQHGAEDQRRRWLVSGVNAAQASLSVAEDQYRTGNVDFLNVLQAQAALLDTRDQLAQSESLELTRLVAVYKALGGGWSR